MNSKSLICVTTCNRLSEVKKYIWDYITFCNKNNDFDFLLALDGNNKEYLDFCNQYQIPLLYSDEREGVGLSKNRVLKQFPDYDYCFFIDDDVELISPIVFNKFIELSNKTKYHNLTLTPLKKVFIKENRYSTIIEKGFYGGGYFNFYTKQGLATIGGWNILFSKYKRYGHSEHSFRFYHSGLSDYPLISLVSCLHNVILHDPPHVTNFKTNLENSINELIPEEEELIKQKTTYFPITTISVFYFNGFNMNYNPTVDEFLLKNKRKYPLTNGKERRIALAEHYFLRIRTTKKSFKKILFFLFSIFYCPTNNPFKHAVKSLFLKKH